MANTLFEVLNVANPAQAVQPNRGSNLMNIAASLGNTASRGITQASGGDIRSQQQKVVGATQGLDPEDPDSMLAAAQKLDVLGDSARATVLRQMAAAKTATNRQAELRERAVSNVADALQRLPSDFEDLAKAVRTGDQDAYETGLDIISRIKEEQALAKIKGEGGVDPEDVRYFVGNMWKDNDNNYYYTHSRTTPSGVSVIHTPVGNAPDYAEQELTPVGGSYSEAAGEVAARTTQTSETITTQDLFRNIQADSSKVINESSASLGELDRLIELATQVKTGGFSAEIANAAISLLGFQPANLGEFEAGGKRLAMKYLDALGANPTDKDVELAQSLSTSIANSRGVNLALLQEARNQLDRRVRSARLATTAENYDDYLGRVNSLYEAVSTPVQTRSFLDYPTE